MKLELFVILIDINSKISIEIIFYLLNIFTVINVPKLRQILSNLLKKLISWSTAIYRPSIGQSIESLFKQLMSKNIYFGTSPLIISP